MDTIYKEAMHIILIFVVLILSSCSNVKKTMGLTQEAPDEYTVIPHKKMEVPDGIYLPEPNQDMTSLAVTPAMENPKTLLVEDHPVKAVKSQKSKSEQALLQHLPTQPDKDIRMQLNKDLKKPGGPQLLFWQKQIKGKPLDAKEEEERLKKESKSHETISSGS